MKYTIQLTKALRADDIVMIIDPKNDVEALDIVQDLKDSSDDGWRMISMRTGQVDGEDDVPGYALRTRTYYDEELGEDVTVTAKAELHTSTGVNTQYDTVAEAVTVINTLDASDGFLLIDEYDQQPKSMIVYERPNLFKDEEGNLLKTNGRVNNHGREDTDRI